MTFKVSFNDPTCQCEDVPNSPYGPVGNEELLARVIISPLHVDPATGQAKPSAFQIVDLKERGLSVLRRGFCSDQELGVQANAMLKGNPERRVHGVLLGQTQKVRDMRDSEARKAFCVVDDEQPGQPMHATIMRSADQTEPELKALRGELMQIFDTMSAIAEA